jgi:hypothetical protein
MKDSKYLPSSSPPLQNEEENVVTDSPLERVLYECLDRLKIKHNSQISKKAFESIKKINVEKINTYGKWIISMKVIAESCATNKHIFSQSEINDFLIIAATSANLYPMNIHKEEKGGKEEQDKIRGVKVTTTIPAHLEKKSEIVKATIFEISKDIMENYQSSNERLKTNYPQIIVDVVSGFAKGIDTEGKRITTYGIKSYYQYRKLNIDKATTTITTTTAHVTTFDTIHKKKGYSNNIFKSRPISSPPSSNYYYYNNNISEEEKSKLIENLNQITGRSKKALELSLADLQLADTIRMRDLCFNYGKLQKYCELIIRDSEEKFKVDLQKELGRNLTDYQLQHAITSLRKARSYIENVLDNKFILHGSHGINHIKHNLEYGYQLMEIMQPSRRLRRK